MKEGVLKSIKITIIYDSSLKKITNTPMEVAVVNRDIPFIMFLYNIFTSYPKIQEKYPPGTLGFSVNGKPPTDFTILQDGDKVEFLISKPSRFN